MNTKILIDRILSEKQISKYRLAKILNVSWNTIQMWHRGVFEANRVHKKNIKKLLHL